MLNTNKIKFENNNKNLVDIDDLVKNFENLTKFLKSQIGTKYKKQ